MIMMCALSLRHCSLRGVYNQISSKVLQASRLQNYKLVSGNVYSARQLFTLQKTLHFRPRYRKDQVPETYKLIYENSQGPLLGISRILSTAGGSLGSVLTLWYLSSRWRQLQHWQIYTLAGACLFCTAAVVSVNVIARFYLMRIYLHEAEGRFIGIHQAFNGRLSQIRYSIEDVHPLTGILSKPAHSKSTVRVKDKSFHLRAADFVLPKYYNAHLKLS